ncbi:MAG: hypothetical protein A2Y33_00905 [Spirochaetes bacterium GWF1_51_8]|nr:MAG: hypothetical protein A2Y33_00905 [Spirochaetes bacterium GWF1_51_8]
MKSLKAAAVLIIVLSAFVLAAGKTEYKPKKRSQFELKSPVVDIYFKPGEGQPIPETVSIAGDYNGWEAGDPEGKLAKQSDGSYKVTIKLLPGCTHHFKFILDGGWVDNMETFVKQNVLKPAPHGFDADGFGGKTAVYIVK